MPHEPDWLRGLPGLHMERGQWHCCGVCHGGDNPRMLGIARGDKGWIVRCIKGCSVEQICAAIGIKVCQLFYDWTPDRQMDKPQKRPRVVKTYDYLSADGELLYQKQRLEPKSFRQRRPMPGGTWAYSLDAGWFRRDRTGWRRLLSGEQPEAGDLEMPEVQRSLYHLDELSAWWACGRDPVTYVTEGEKACDALRKIGCAATCGSEGAGRWRTEHSRLLAPHRVVVLPDNDEPGLEHAARVAGSLQLWGGAAKILRLPDLDTGQDVFDWLAKFPRSATARDKRLALYSLAAGAREHRPLFAASAG